MLFAIGSRIRLRFTGESGVISGTIDEYMVKVRLDSDPTFDIPTYLEDLVRDEVFEPRDAQTNALKVKQVNTQGPPPRRTINSQYQPEISKGLQIAFEPMPGRDETISKYKAWLLNDTKEEFLFKIDLYTTQRDVITLDDMVGALSVVELGDLVIDDLSDHPEVWISVERFTTAGPDTVIEKTLKIRPKTFFNNLMVTPYLNVMTHLFVLLPENEFHKKQDKENEPDLKAYAKQNVSKTKTSGKANSQPYRPFNVEEFAEFIPEIDLHIQALMPGYARLDKSEIMRIQLLHFQKFMDKAVRLGVANAFIIHGVGEGKLRDTIAERLRDNPHVKKFKNEYHHKFGYGATEVIFE